MLEHPSPYGCLLADSDIWSELLSILFVLLFFAVPAIIRALSESSKKKRPQDEKQSAPEKTFDHKTLSQRRQQFQLDWDRRQQLIRKRLAALKEKEQVFAAPKRAPAQPPPIKPPVKEILPMAMPVYKEPSPYMPTEKTATPQQQPLKRTKQLPRKLRTATTHSVLDRIMATANPLQAGIILKEILDKPKAFRIDSNL